MFKPYYLSMVLDALGNRRVMRVVQPQPRLGGDQGVVTGIVKIYDQSRVGRIVSCNEISDDRWPITLIGLCCFYIKCELALTHDGYRQVEVDYNPFRADIEELAEPLIIDRKQLLACLKFYFAQHRITMCWKVQGSLTGTALVTAVAMLCQFDAREKQYL